MAQQHVALLVIRQGQVAEAALLDMAARRAVDVRRKAAAVEQQHHLAAVLQGSVHGLFERFAQRPDSGPAADP